MNFLTKLNPWAKPASASQPPSDLTPVQVSQAVDTVTDFASEFDPSFHSILRDVNPDYTGSIHTVREAMGILREAFPGLGTFMDSFGFRKFGAGYLDINASARLSLLKRIHDMSLRNPLANRSLDIWTDLIYSEGFTIEFSGTESKLAGKVLEIANSHWVTNDWDTRFASRIRDTLTDGELVRVMPSMSSSLPGFEGFPYSRFEAGTRNPYRIMDVACDGHNEERVVGIKLSVPDADATAAFGSAVFKPQVFEVVRKVIYPGSTFAMTGSVFYWNINRRAGSSRGHSMLLPAMEWMDMHDQVLFTEAERTRNLLKHIWDVTLVGADPRRVAQRTAEIQRTPPNNGTVYVHNEKETWRSVVPGLSASQSVVLIEKLFRHGWGAAGLPELWYVSSPTAGKTASESQEGPVWVKARNYRNFFIKCVEQELAMAVYVAAMQDPDLKSYAAKDGALSVRLVGKDPDRTAYDASAKTILSMGQALGNAINTGLMDKANAIEAFFIVCQSAGLILNRDTLPNPEDLSPLEKAQQEKIQVKRLRDRSNKDGPDQDFEGVLKSAQAQLEKKKSDLTKENM